MLGFQRVLLGLIAVFLAVQMSAQSPPPPRPEARQFASYSLLTERDPILALQGAFRFHPGDHPSWSDPNFEDSAWPLVPGYRSWSQSGYRNLSGVAWYRFTLQLPPGNEVFALRLPRINSSYQLFVDGHLAHTQGRLPPRPRTYFAQPALVTLPAYLRTTPTTLHLAIRVWISAEVAAHADGGMQGAIVVGPAAQLVEDFHASQVALQATSRSALDLGLLELVVGLTALTLFVFSRSEAEYLWFALLALGLAGQNIVEFWSTARVAPVFFTETVGLLWLRCFQVSFLLFLRRLLNARWTVFLWITLGFVCLSLADDLLWGLPHLVGTTAGNLIDNFFDLPVFFWSLALVIHRAWKRWPDARVLAAPVILLLLTQQFSAIATTLEVAGRPGLELWSEQHLALKSPIQADYTQLGETVFLLAMLAILIHRFTRSRREQDRTLSEFHAAREVQQILVPKHLPETPGLHVSTAYYPAQEVGGDFFQVFALPAGATLLVIGDVSGKGMPAALTVSLAIGSLSTLVDSTESPAAILAGLNRRLYRRSVGFTTCIALRFEPIRMEGHFMLTLASAGHLAPYVNGTELPTEVSLPLGLDENTAFTEATFPLKQGDHLAVLTDGIPEAMQSGKLLGFARTAQLSRLSAMEIAEAARLYGQADDITVLTIDVLGTSAPLSQTCIPVPC